MPRRPGEHRNERCSSVAPGARDLAREIAWTLGWAGVFVLVFGTVTMRLYNRK